MGVYEMCLEDVSEKKIWELFQILGGWLLIIYCIVKTPRYVALEITYSGHVATLVIVGCQKIFLSFLCPSYKIEKMKKTKVSYRGRVV